MKQFVTIFFSILLFSLISCNSKNLTLQDGEFYGTGEGRGGPVTVSVKVKNHNVESVNVISEAESDFAKPVFKKMSDSVISGTSIKDLDGISGATLTSDAMRDALTEALNASKGIAKKAKKYKNTKCDVVVIGSGGAGLAAAVEASSKDLKVIVLEKMGIVGGNSNYSTGGINASETSVQKKLGIKDSNEQFFKDTMTGGHNLNDPVLVQNLVEKSADAIDWLISLGADLSDVGKMAGSTNKRTHRPTGGFPIGSHLVSVLHRAADENDVEIRLRNTVKEIIEEDGKATGVVVSTENGEYTIKASAVVVATGGFGANPELLAKYKPELKEFGTTNHKGATGDAFRLIEKFDASLVQMEQIQTHPTVVPGSGIMITEAVRGNGAIMVNQNGTRFNNEMATRDVMSKAILSQEGKIAYLLFDQGVRESLKAIEDYAAKGLLTQGETLSELAEKLGISSSELESTVVEYNAFQKNGVDLKFGRPASDMPRPLLTAPFYAVKVEPAVHHTMGGLKINTKAQVINSKGEVIPGLFAAGEVTGGVHGGNRLGGNAVADIIIYGRIAGDSAASYIDSLY